MPGLAPCPILFRKSVQILKIESSPQRRKGRKEIFYLAVRGRQIKRLLLLTTNILSSAKPVYKGNNLFP
jgi:hypothetical protein